MESRYFPFAALGFQCNPFRALTEDEWATVAVIPSEVHKLAIEGNTHLQILGDAGHGKSTLLRGLASKFGEIGTRIHFEYLPLGQRRFKTPPSIFANIDIFLLDEAQRLTRWQRKKLFSLATRHHIRLILGTHEDFASLFIKNNLSYTTVTLERIESATLRAMLGKRMDYFRTDTPPQVDMETDVIDYLISRFGRNLRQLEYYLYEVFQFLAEKQRIQAISADLLTEIDPHIIIPAGLE